ncbi:Resolvase, HTH domain containing protein [uncultured Caudovirales phage]|uniref:Resolvase, HTH domain containing protein n=1 Tax=uncultured Caudovirales phage TaxID=2100421 RepID=A0A6J5MQB4_9CAUD|nr:Resolvase, HTH domain containing protein [uncultured Caudovirales phage]
MGRHIDLNAEQIARLRELVDQGITRLHVAERMGCSVFTVYKHTTDKHANDSCQCGKRKLATKPMCFRCQYAMTGRPAPKLVSKGHKHVSTSVFVQHDPIAARVRWAQAVGR